MNLFNEIKRVTDAVLVTTGIGLIEPKKVCQGCIHRTKGGCCKLNKLSATGRRLANDCYTSEIDHQLERQRLEHRMAHDHFAANPNCQSVSFGSVTYRRTF